LQHVQLVLSTDICRTVDTCALVCVRMNKRRQKNIICIFLSRAFVQQAVDSEGSALQHVQLVLSIDICGMVDTCALVCV
jgi:hypothetical protein